MVSRLGSVDYQYIQYAQCIKDTDLHAVDFFVKVYWVNLGWMDVAVQSLGISNRSSDHDVHNEKIIKLLDCQRYICIYMSEIQQTPKDL